MDLDRIAQAFAAGFTVGRAMAMDAARDGDEDGHWVTVGAEAGPDGEKHGGRHVLISGSGTIKKGISKSAEGKTLGQVFGKGSEFSTSAERKQAKVKFKRPISEFMQKTKFRPDTFAEAWMKYAPNGAATLDKITKNLPDAYKNLLKKTLPKLKFKHTVEGYAGFDAEKRVVEFNEGVFKGENTEQGYSSDYQLVLHEVGHAVDSIATKRQDGAPITTSNRLRKAIVQDVKSLLAEQREAIKKRLAQDDVYAYRIREKWERKNMLETRDPTDEELENIGISEVLNAQAKAEINSGRAGVMIGLSDMISALTMNRVRDGGYHDNDYWSRSPYMMTTEFMAHTFAASVYNESNSLWRATFPRATGVLDKLIHNTAKTKKEA